MKQHLLSLCALITLCACNDREKIPADTRSREGFVYTHEAIPGAFHEIRYFSGNNFIGRRVDGYQAAVAMLTREAASALNKVQEELGTMGYAIKIFDAYRPQMAVDHFMRWADDPADTLMKAEYYPDIDKGDLFALGYLIEKSGHTRGSTIDLTIVDKATGEELDMGSTYDFFGEISHHGTSLITEAQEANRNLLRDLMIKHGFKILPEEWWHYTLVNEPHPDTYFRFELK